MLPVERYVHR